MVNSLDYQYGSSAFVLDGAQCLELLRGACVGRVILSVECIPVAVPVNLSMLGDDVLLATDSDSKLTSGVHGQVVSVQADDFDLTSGSGWSVLVTGVAQQVTEQAEIDWARKHIHAWLPGADPLLIKVPSTLVSGRRFVWSAPPTTGSEVDARPA